MVHKITPNFPTKAGNVDGETYQNIAAA